MHAPAVFLFGLFCLLKYFPNLDIQSLLSAYFWLLGSVSLVGVFAPSLRTLVRVWGWGWGWVEGGASQQWGEAVGANVSGCALKLRGASAEMGACRALCVCH